MFKMDLVKNEIHQVDVEDDGENCNCDYRVGTPGYPLSKNKYFGFGHRTYFVNSKCIHDIFLWIVSFEKKPQISIYDCKQPPNSKNICDPTSVVNIDEELYLITAESDHPWFRDQDYLTNVYKIRGIFPL